MGQHKKLLTPLKVACLVFSFFALTFIINTISTNSVHAAETKCLQFSYKFNGKSGYKSAPVCFPVENGKITKASEFTVNGGNHYGDTAAWDVCDSATGLCTIANNNNGVYIGFGLKNGANDTGYGDPTAVCSSSGFKVYGCSSNGGYKPVKDGDDWEATVTAFNNFYKDYLAKGQLSYIDPVTGESVDINVEYEGNASSKASKENEVDPGTGDVIINPGTGDIITEEPTEDDDGEIDSREAGCYQESGSMGWIICPMIFGMRDVATGIYDGIEGFLQISDSIVGSITEGTSGSGSIFNAWTLFRNIANILFVIFFLFVIFSQLTGYGIDNYGIKKMLPKLIITAILVNLSFIICAIAVDISNILGHTLNNFFSTLSVNASINGAAIDAANPAATIRQIIAYVVDTALVVGATGGILAASIALGGWSLVLPILLFLLTFVISVVFAFVALGLRQAAVVVLIAIAPVAFALNILPNTEKYFKKWIDAFKGVLVVYPIIGALVGGGNFAGRVLIGTGGDFLMVLVAGLLFVVPFFLIPSLTRKSLDGIGNLGSRLQGLRRGATGSARNAINGTQAAKNFRSDMNERQAQARAQRYLNSRRGRRTREALERGDNVSIRQARRFSRAQELAQTGTKANLAAYDTTLSATETGNKLTRMQNEGFAAREAGIRNKALEDAITDQMALYEDDGTFSNLSKFQTEVENAAANNDSAKLEALMRTAAKGNDHQREHLILGMNNAFRSGNVSEEMAARYAGHIQSNGIYKTQDRSANDQADHIMRLINGEINGQTYASANGADLISDNFAGRGIINGKQTGAMAFNFDDGEFNTLVRGMNNLSSDDRKKISETMGNALYLKQNDPTGQYNNVKPETLDQIRKVIAAANGMDVNNASQEAINAFVNNGDYIHQPESVLNVDHSNSGNQGQQYFDNDGNPTWDAGGSNPAPTQPTPPTPTQPAPTTPRPTSQAQSYFDDNGNATWDAGTPAPVQPVSAPVTPTTQPASTPSQLVQPTQAPASQSAPTIDTSLMSSNPDVAAAEQAALDVMNRERNEANLRNAVDANGNPLFGNNNNNNNNGDSGIILP
ncbi:hypothetical protein IJI76_03710 [Candidatus Saccharibacteria bacterium]|nr:hypothetical protein [Candidatus Saccharibacteria bacterium]